MKFHSIIINSDYINPTKPLWNSTYSPSINKINYRPLTPPAIFAASNLQCLGAGRAKPSPGAAKEATGPRHPVRDQWLFQGQICKKQCFSNMARRKIPWKIPMLSKGSLAKSANITPANGGCSIGNWWIPHRKPSGASRCRCSKVAWALPFSRDGAW